MKGASYLITGANGEIGHTLIQYLRENFENVEIVAYDIAQLDERLDKYKPVSIRGDILDRDMIYQIIEKYEFNAIFHLASILSTKAEKNPELAHAINIEGTMNLFKALSGKYKNSDYKVKFIYPSSMAVYGLPNLNEKAKAGKVREDEFLNPITMYGCNKLYCEQLGQYYALHYRLIEENEHRGSCIDFRALRFPGLISAITVPTGGTSDYGPEMLHMAAQGKPYDCFVREGAALPFMVMPDAVKSLLMLEAAERNQLTKLAYNVTSYSCTAKNFRDTIREIFPQSEINFVPTPSRQLIVDSWPQDLNDDAARKDWGWSPDFDYNASFEDYLAPSVKARYRKA